MNWPEIVKSVKSILGSPNFPVGVLLGASLSVLITVLKKQLEEHASTLLSKAPSFATKLINFRLWEARYRKVIAKEHRFIRLVGIRQQLELKPPRLKDVYVNLELEAPSSQTKTQHLQPALTLHETFQIRSIVNNFQRVVILGNPGAGKTTLLEHLIALSARRKGDDLDSSWLPVYVPLRRCLLNGRPLVDELTDPSTGIVSPELLRRYPLGFFESKLEDGKCLVLFDGLDEVLDQDRHVAAARLVQRCGVLYPGSHIMVTSRIAGWRGLLGSDFSRFVIRELSHKEIERLINQWYFAVLLDTAKSEVLTFTEELSERTRRQAQDLAARMLAVISSNEHLQEIASTPLILSLMCLVYYVRQDLPQRRAELYNECSRVLLREWDEMDKQLSPGVSLTYDDKSLLLQRIAMHLFCYSASDLAREDLISLISAFARDRDRSLDPENVLRHIHERSGLVTEKAIGTYAFAHLTFQEYFTALGLLASQDGLPLLLENLRRGESQEVALLYAGAARNANVLVASLCDEYEESARLEQLLLAATAATESHSISLELKTRIVERLNKHFDVTRDGETLLRLQKALRGLGVDRDIIRTFEDYQILEELGRGGFATTYRAIEISTRQPVAIKVFHSGTGRYAAEMAKEIDQLKYVKHPALVEVLAVGNSKDQLFVAMELVPGVSLEWLFQDCVRRYNGPYETRIMPPHWLRDAERNVAKRWEAPTLASSEYFRWVGSMAHDVVDGVAALHNVGLVHGDLKPSNVLAYRLDSRDRAKVSDFCVDAIIARANRLSSRVAEMSTVPLGSRSIELPFSVRFAAPELLRGFDGQLTARIDVYSMGVLFADLFLLSLTTFDDPSAPRKGHLPRDLLLQESEAYRRISDSGLSRVLKMATSKDATKRFTSVTEFWEAVERSMPNI